MMTRGYCLPGRLASSLRVGAGPAHSAVPRESLIRIGQAPAFRPAVRLQQADNGERNAGGREFVLGRPHRLAFQRCPAAMRILVTRRVDLNPGEIST